MQSLDLFGISCGSLLRQTPAAEKLCDQRAVLFSLLYGSPSRPFTTGYDDNGNVTEFTPMAPLERWQYVPIPLIKDASPDLGMPYQLAVMRPINGRNMFGQWDDAATFLCSEAYRDARIAALHGGEDGYHVARFLGHTAPKYAARGPSRFNTRRYHAEILEMSLIARAKEKAHPEWVQGLALTEPPTPIGISN